MKDFKNDIDIVIDWEGKHKKQQRFDFFVGVFVVIYFIVGCAAATIWG